MTRRRFVYFDGVAVEVTRDFVQEPARHDEVLWNDRSYDNMKATDGTDISSRAKHKAYMKEKGWTTADDFKSEFSPEGQKRLVEQRRNAINSSRKAQIIEAYQKVKAGYRPRIEQE